MFLFQSVCIMTCRRFKPQSQQTHSRHGTASRKSTRTQSRRSTNPNNSFADQCASQPCARVCIDWKEAKRETEAEAETDRQTDRQRERETDRGRQKDRQIERQTDRCMHAPSHLCSTFMLVCPCITGRILSLAFAPLTL